MREIYEKDGGYVDNGSFIAQGTHRFKKLRKQVAKSEVKVVSAPDANALAGEAAARAYLSETDWYVTRFSETGKEIPAEVREKRAEARLTIPLEGGS